MADLRNVIIPGWNTAWSTSPAAVVCANACSENILIKRYPSSDPDVGGYAAVTLADVRSNTTPVVWQHVHIKILDTLTFDHPCGAVDSGCTGAANHSNDDRHLLAHEFGHALGLAHCDLDFGVMCAVTASGTVPSADSAGGTSFWLPQETDIWALKAVYP